MDDAKFPTMQLRKACAIGRKNFLFHGKDIKNESFDTGWRRFANKVN